ncbi:hypothetical protein CHCC5026_1744 [Bacillus licheniformis]|nr:hypothetical protein CHCC5026_1744 [Bacillus licheniformis]
MKIERQKAKKPTKYITPKQIAAANLFRSKKYFISAAK